MLGEKKGLKKGLYSRGSRQPESLLAQTRGLLRRFDLTARKRLGQHFLIDREVLNAITAAAELAPADVVMEVGPGLGVLTRELARQAGRVIAIELDNTLATILRETMAACGNLTVINEDVLKIDPVALLQETKESTTDASSSLSYKVVANLPYYITSPVLRHFLEATLKPTLMVVMVQKEVAEQIVAKSGRMSLMSISVQFYGEPEIIDYVPARCFYPPPEVDSAILRVTPYLQPAVAVDDIAGFFRLVRAGFTATRKQLANSLARGLGVPKAEALSLLERAGIKPQRRAETLTLEEWAHLWRILSQMEKMAC